MFLAPAEAAKNDIERFTVSVLPEVEKEEPAASTRHWLFWAVPQVPRTSGLDGKVPASFAR